MRSLRGGLVASCGPVRRNVWLYGDNATQGTQLPNSPKSSRDSCAYSCSAYSCSAYSCTGYSEQRPLLLSVPVQRTSDATDWDVCCVHFVECTITTLHNARRNHLARSIMCEYIPDRRKKTSCVRGVRRAASKRETESLVCVGRGGVTVGYGPGLLTRISHTEGSADARKKRPPHAP